MKLPVLSAKSKGFTLLELLVVIGIISILLVMAAPTVLSLIGANRLTATGEQVVSFLSDAQQSASANGTAYEVRFYEERLPHSEDVGIRSVLLCRTYQVGEPNPDPHPDRVGVPLTEPVSIIAGEFFQMPDEVFVSQSASESPLIGNLLSDTSSMPPLKIIRGDTLQDFTLPSGEGTGKVASFLIRPEGTSLVQGAQWFLTLGEVGEKVRVGDDPTSWKNFFCIQIDPVNGRLTSYRP